MANPIEKRCGSGGMPSERASTIKHAAFSNAKRTPIQKFPIAAAAMIPTPIKPRVNIGPLAKATGETDCESTSIAKIGTATPDSTTAQAVGNLQARGCVTVKSFMAQILTKTSGRVDQFGERFKGPEAHRNDTLRGSASIVRSPAAEL
ncbi:MAG: hypothetical protein ACFBZ9_01690 [Sphingomonadales bacterium]